MNIAVIGSGYWGKNIVKNYHELNSLYAICEIDPNKINDLKEKYPGIKVYSDYNTLLSDKSIDGIAIATPAHTHFSLAKQSLEAGFPTYVEKPLTLNLKDAEFLTDLAQDKNIPLMVGHIMEFNPAIVKMKQLIDNGTLGNIKHIRCTRVNLGKIRAHENIWWSFAPHDLSIIFMLLDQEPINIHVCTFKPLQDNIEDTIYADLLFKDGKSAHIHVSWLEPFKLHQTVIIGDKAMLVFNDTATENKLMLHQYSFDKNTPNLTKESETPVNYQDKQPLKVECQHFMDCIENNLHPKTDGISACRVIKVLEYVDSKLKKEVVI